MLALFYTIRVAVARNVRGTGSSPSCPPGRGKTTIDNCSVSFAAVHQRDLLPRSRRGIQRVAGVGREAGGQYRGDQTRFVVVRRISRDADRADDLPL
jgi:hypothetical protein